MSKRPASTELDSWRRPIDRSELSEPKLTVNGADKLPSWFETFIKSDADRDRLLKVPQYRESNKLEGT